MKGEIKQPLTISKHIKYTYISPLAKLFSTRDKIRQSKIKLVIEIVYKFIPPIKYKYKSNLKFNFEIYTSHLIQLKIILPITKK